MHPNNIHYINPINGQNPFDENNPQYDTEQIQNAIDNIATATDVYNSGFKGAIVLSSGTFYIHETIEVDTDGIIISGIGGDINDQERTLIVHKINDDNPDNDEYGWYNYPYKNTFTVGKGGTDKLDLGNEHTITDLYVPIGSHTFRVDNLGVLQEQDSIVININPTQQWIDDQLLDNVQLANGNSYDGSKWNDLEFFRKNLRLERKIIDINTDTNEITIDAPITTSLWNDNVTAPCSGGNEPCFYNNATIQKIETDYRLTNIGFQDLILASDYDCANISDENHPKIGIYFRSGKNGWVKNVQGFFYSYALVRSIHSIFDHTNGVELWQVFHGLTVEDCAMFDGISTDNISSGAGEREYYFDINGSSSLVQRCYGRNARHTFAQSGPSNLVTFLDCVAVNGTISSEPHQNYSHGVLFDNLYTEAPVKLNSTNYLHGQRTANSTIWNLTSYKKNTLRHFVYLDKPYNLRDENNNIEQYSLGQQWLVGAKLNPHPDVATSQQCGDVLSPSRFTNPVNFSICLENSGFTFLGNEAHVEHVDNHVYPRSLFLRQLKDRIGDDGMNDIAVGLQTNEDPNSVGETLANELIDKYATIPEFMCIDELIAYTGGEDCDTQVNSFDAPETWLEQNPYYSDYSNYGFHVGDFNDDGREDIVSIKKNNLRFVGWLAQEQDANGYRFDMHKQWYSNLHNYSGYDFNVGDFNGDGKDDVVSVRKNNLRFVGWLGKEPTTQSSNDYLDSDKEWYSNSHNYSGYDFNVGDFNGDGKDDVVSVRKNNLRFVGWLGKEPTTQSSNDYLDSDKEWYSNSHNYSSCNFHVGDFNGDGKDDIIAIRKYNLRFVGWQGKEPTTQSSNDYLDSDKEWHIEGNSFYNYEFKIGDFNGDGKDDVIGISKNEPKLMVWLAKDSEAGTGHRFEEKTIWYNGSTSYSNDLFFSGNFNTNSCNDEIIAIDDNSIKFDVWQSELADGQGIIDDSAGNGGVGIIIGSGGDLGFDGIGIRKNSNNNSVTIKIEKELYQIKAYDFTGREINVDFTNLNEVNLPVNTPLIVIATYTDGSKSTKKVVLTD